MKIKIFLFIILLVISTYSIGFSNTFTVLAHKGNVQFKQSSASRWSRVYIRASIGQYGWILTGPNGIILLRMSNGGTVKIGQNTIIGLSRYSNRRGTQINIQRGSALFKLNRLRGKPFSARTPSVVAGVRGTTFAIIVDGDLNETKTEVVVHKGEVEVKKFKKTVSAEDEDESEEKFEGKPVILKAKQAISVSHSTKKNVQSKSVDIHDELEWEETENVEKQIIERNYKTKTPKSQSTPETKIDYSLKQTQKQEKEDSDDENESSKKEESDDNDEDSIVAEKKESEYDIKLKKAKTWLDSSNQNYSIDSLKNIITLNLSESNTNDNNISNITILNTLQILNLNKTKITNKALKYISQLNKLKYINFSNCNISDQGIKQLSKLKGLEILILQKTQITNKGLSYLKRFKKLRILDISKCNIGNTGLKHLSKLQILEVLILGSTKITDNGLKYLTKLKKLKELSIIDTSISNKGIKHLKKIKSLRELYYAKSKITEKGIEGLQKSNENLKAKKEIFEDKY